MRKKKNYQEMCFPRLERATAFVKAWTNLIVAIGGLTTAVASLWLIASKLI